MAAAFTWLLEMPCVLPVDVALLPPLYWYAYYDCPVCAPCVGLPSRSVFAGSFPAVPTFIFLSILYSIKGETGFESVLSPLISREAPSGSGLFLFASLI